MIVLLVIVSIGILLYGYVLMCRLDRFFERGGFAQILQAPLQKEILLYGEQPAMDEIRHMLDDQHILYDYTGKPDIEGDAVYRWIGAFSKDDADNLLICMVGKRRNSAVRTIAVCNDTLYEDVFRQMGISVIVRNGIQASRIIDYIKG